MKNQNRIFALGLTILSLLQFVNAAPVTGEQDITADWEEAMQNEMIPQSVLSRDASFGSFTEISDDSDDGVLGERR
jgi:hypothetical protein